MPTVADLLAQPVLRQADPLLLTGPSTAETVVRWVHTSEIYDIGPLLSGGELLLTTGLGLVAATDADLVRYVDSLADRAVAGWCLELGRTFDRVPTVVLARAEERGLAVVALREVVPFVAITEEALTLLLGSGHESLRMIDGLVEELVGEASGGADLATILAVVARHLGADVALVDPTGRIAAATDARAAGGALTMTVSGAGQPWGRLVTQASGDRARAMLVRAAQLVGALAPRPEQGLTAYALARRRVAAALLGRQGGAGELDAAARTLSLLPSVTRPIQVLAIDVAQAGTEPLVPLVEAAVRRVARRVVAAAAPHAVLAAFPVSPADDPLDVGRRVSVEVDAALAAGQWGRVRRTVVGRPADALLSFVDECVTVRETVAVAARTTVRDDVVLASDLVLHRFLAGQLHHEGLTQLIDGQLGVVLDHDARHRYPLLPTLEAYVTHGGNKQATAQALGIQRQTLYGRLERLADLAGHDFESPVRRLSLQVALTAWRLRSSAAAWSPRRP